MGAIRRLKMSWISVFFIAPSLVSFLAFKYIPLVYAAFMSFFDYDFMKPPGRFMGLDNYSLLLKSTYFWTALYNTFAIGLLSLLLTFWVPILQALLLTGIKQANALYRFLYLVPVAVPAIAGIVLWKWIYNPDYGLANEWLGKLGLPPLMWLSDPSLAKLALVIPGMLGGGLGVLIYYSALQGISVELLESAKMDGAGPWRRLLAILLPNMRFVIGIQFISFLAGVFLSFDAIFVMTGGGPANSTKVLTMLVYETAFKQNRFGSASAISLIVFVIVGIFSYVQIRVSSRG
ncbi:sugar ABC transporter permease [Paenibacillus sp. 598K]|uniref:carbohydrate ABC transporter permease n=1 Tax=Paenibacillus sp. 598K TaxID=1117987 RepID=UPI000FF9DFC8|nr:sugar ABC transporter permease [Paenibacillus sp. 598K]GBF72540.1 sugar ABC transporter permease [Paenibacillus sp. 598K]